VLFSAKPRDLPSDLALAQEVESNPFMCVCCQLREERRGKGTQGKCPATSQATPADGSANKWVKEPTFW